jgi:hypothetical protein
VANAGVVGVRGVDGSLPWLKRYLRRFVRGRQCPRLSTPQGERSTGTGSPSRVAGTIAVDEEPNIDAVPRPDGQRPIPMCSVPVRVFRLPIRSTTAASVWTQGRPANAGFRTFGNHARISRSVVHFRCSMHWIGKQSPDQRGRRMEPFARGPPPSELTSGLPRAAEPGISASRTRRLRRGSRRQPRDSNG